MMSDDGNLLPRAVAGEQDALAALLERYGPAVRSSISGQIPDRFRPLLSEDDVMQETYTDAFLSISSFDLSGSFLAWLKTVARNNLFDAIRGLQALSREGERRRVEHSSSHDQFSAFIESVCDSGTTPSGHAMRRELKESLKNVLEQLPENYRRVVQLYDLECRSIEETARSLGCSAGAVFMRRARALRMLRSMLESFSIYV